MKRMIVDLKKVLKKAARAPGKISNKARPIMSQGIETTARNSSKTRIVNNDFLYPRYMHAIEHVKYNHFDFMSST